MAHLLLVAFPDVRTAHAAGTAIAALQDRVGTAAEDIAIMSRAASNRIAVDHLTRGTTGEALGGGRWGALIGTLLVIDADRPSALLKRAGLEAGLLQSVARELDRGSAVLGLRVRQLGMDRVLACLSAHRLTGQVFRAELSAKGERALSAMAAEFPEHVAQ